MSEDKPNRLCVLIVDDEMLNRELLRRVLHRNYEIEEAEDANQALTILNRRGDDIKLILCDQLMPNRLGTQLAAEVRERWPAIQFLLLTGYDDDPVVRDARDQGLIGDVVAKPWRGASLKRRIAAMLSS